MLSLVAAAVLSQVNGVGTQICSVSGDIIVVHVVIEDVRVAFGEEMRHQILYSFQCRDDGECSGATLNLSSVASKDQAGTVTSLDLKSMGSKLRVKSRDGHIAVVEQGLTQFVMEMVPPVFTIDFKEGTVTRTVGKKSSVGHCYKKWKATDSPAMR